jgi:hypothetical protein
MPTTVEVLSGGEFLRSDDRAVVGLQNYKGGESEFVPADEAIPHFVGEALEGCDAASLRWQGRRCGRSCATERM